jgi:hypothetical protein
MAGDSHLSLCQATKVRIAKSEPLLGKAPNFAPDTQARSLECHAYLVGTVDAVPANQDLAN